ncbi:GNAT family N-acetyltransferase [Endozoicomonas gorgoniicola]|uniref:GNAT family N-acetyltransferase n=1 Tax=Endozoicomonas gorgoniicola TaxID=1234144 RepID=A0ABT3MPT8_9GAMM|nr:GNAT family N-acetyltransferase [Endozoicomonas gorgoniicola]MCW7551388.1 GNAT family N-acetyltransferase [Endozoicomonas gorgoniicola]
MKNECVESYLAGQHSKDKLESLLKDSKDELQNILVDLDLNELAAKWHKNACVFEYLVEDSTAGVIIFYANDPKKSAAFITLVVTYPDFRKKGIGASLLAAVKDYCRKNGFLKIKLETYSEKLMNWYEQNDFYLTGKTTRLNSSTEMQLTYQMEYKVNHESEKKCHC